jgi:hypothetical protein
VPPRREVVPRSARPRAFRAATAACQALLWNTFIAVRNRNPVTSSSAETRSQRSHTASGRRPRDLLSLLTVPGDEAERAEAPGVVRLEEGLEPDWFGQRDPPPGLRARPAVVAASSPMNTRGASRAYVRLADLLRGTRRGGSGRVRAFPPAWFPYDGLRGGPDLSAQQPRRPLSGGADTSR